MSASGPRKQRYPVDIKSSDAYFKHMQSILLELQEPLANGDEISARFEKGIENLKEAQTQETPEIRFYRAH